MLDHAGPRAKRRDGTRLCRRGTGSRSLWSDGARGREDPRARGGAGLEGGGFLKDLVLRVSFFFSRISGCVLRGWGLDLGVSGFGCRVQGVGLRI